MSVTSKHIVRNRMKISFYNDWATDKEFGERMDKILEKTGELILYFPDEDPEDPYLICETDCDDFQTACEVEADIIDLIAEFEKRDVED